MAEKKSKAADQKSTEFATQKIDPEKLTGDQSSGKETEHPTRKIDDSLLEAAVAQEAIDTAATMKVTKAEMKKALEEELSKAKEMPSSTPAVDTLPAMPEAEKPKITTEPGESKSSAISKINTTVATIIAVGIVLAACICLCALVVAAIIFSGGSF